MAHSTLLCLAILLPLALQRSTAIVSRDLLLTPKAGLQLTGKRIYYEEPPQAATQRPPLANPPEQEQRPWERTLKHVTYVTLFTDAAAGAAAGNLSQLHDYHAFLQSPYLPLQPHEAAPQSRFGDIMTLASGRLEQLPHNGSYRFVEGSCGYSGACKRDTVWALWQVQKIRHREGEQTEPLKGRTRRYHYEMKFSVMPLQRKASWPQWPQSFIQKEADYPQTFGRIVYNEEREEPFAERRLDRNFRQAAAGAAAAAAPADEPQATFVHGIFQPPPPPLPAAQAAPGPPKLNIGEYIKSTPKIELFPNIFNVGGLGLRQSYIAPTTFRPNYQMKFVSHPTELYGPQAQPQHELPLANELGLEAPALGSGAAGVTHHFHHHFYMAPPTAEQRTPEQLLNNYKPLEVTTTRPYSTASAPFQVHTEQRIQFPTYPTPPPLSAESGETDSSSREQEDLVVQVTPVPLRRPHIYGQASKYQAAKLPPLLIYAAGEEPAPASVAPKPFVQSEPLEETIYRYSEPDPLYEPLETIDPLLQAKRQQQQQVDDLNDQHVATEEPRAQATPVEQRPAGSQKLHNVAIANGSSTTTTTTTTTTSTTVAPVLALPTATAATHSAIDSRFVSTSTHTTPLRALSRYRNALTNRTRITAGKSTTTTTTSTELPLLKWKPRRKEQNATSAGSQLSINQERRESHDTKAKSSQRHEAKVAFVPTRVPLPAPAAVPARETIEVLTQKSVSKSVSIKVGANGEEIPVIVDDDENEVQRS